MNLAHDRPSILGTGNAKKRKGSGEGRALQWLKLHVDHDGDGCLIWPFSRISSGYGDLAIDGEYYLAHRIMCDMAHGAPPVDKPFALHSCHNGHSGCVHPKHLRWGTNTENQEDRVAAGTSNRGRGAKLTEDEVREIRSLRGTISQSGLADKFGVSRGAIQLILDGRNWKWLL